MNIETTVRLRHEFEDRVKDLLRLASLMTDRELEITLARLADTVVSQPAEGHQIKLTGSVLNEYYGLRKAGVRKQRKFERWKYRESSEEFISYAADFTLLANDQLVPPSSSRETSVEETVKALSR